MPGHLHESEPSKRQCRAEAQPTCEASALLAHVPGQTAVAQAVDSRASAVGPAQQPISLPSQKHEVSAYMADLPAINSSQEVSFEEVRAASWLARQARMKQVGICFSS